MPPDRTIYGNIQIIRFLGTFNIKAQSRNRKKKQKKTKRISTSKFTEDGCQQSDFCERLITTDEVHPGRGLFRTK